MSFGFSILKKKAGVRIGPWCAGLALGFLILQPPQVAWASSDLGANNGSGSCLLDDRISNIHTSASGPAGSIDSMAGTSLASLVSSWGKSREECKNRNYLAQKECLEACSGKAQGQLGSANNIGSMMDVIGGVFNQTCQQQQQASDEMKKGYEAYSQACKSTQTACNQACESAKKLASEILSAAQAAPAACSAKGLDCSGLVQQLVQLVQQDDQKSPEFVAGKIDQCSRDFSNRLAGAGEVLKGLMGMLSAGKKCEDESKGSETAGNEKTCAELTYEEKMLREDCICEVSPNSAGCRSGDNTAGTEFGQSESGDPINGDSSGGGRGRTPTSQTNMTLPTGGSSGTASAAGAAGYAGATGGTGAATGASRDREADKESKLNADILSGEGGGGGGGGGFGWSGSGSSEADAKAGRSGALRASSSIRKDPTMTGAGGSDNWKKVKTRYFENRPTFLDEK